jgi:L-amino acid N-acyltransferase YncA
VADFYSRRPAGDVSLVGMTGRLDSERTVDRPARSAITVLPMTEVHADAVLAIYQRGLDGGQASFETTAPPWPEWDAAHLRDHRFVAFDGDAVVGWVAVSPVSDRCVYHGVVELSVYVDPVASGRGVGRRLLDELIASTEAAGIWTLQSGIFPENTASLRLHAAAGFRVVGTRERVGQHHGRWRDVVFIERRSPVVGS